jgi:hypothetical protein
MSNDTLWDTFRNGLIAGGTLLAGYGWFDVAKVEPFINNAMAIGGALMAVGTFAWTIWVKFGTKAVPMIVASQPEIPTVSAITGRIEPASDTYSTDTVGMAEMPPVRKRPF